MSADPGKKSLIQAIKPAKKLRHIVTSQVSQRSFLTLMSSSD